MTSRVRPAAVAVALLVAMVAAPVGLATSPVRADTTASECENQVVYDAFRFNDRVVNAAANDSATATAQNTEVRVEQNAGFIRVNASNPNGYCLEFHVRLNASIVSPAELGEVSSNDGTQTADWHAVHDFETDTTYTEVVFTLPSARQATFAPSKLRVKTLSWTGTAEQTGSGLWGTVKSWAPGGNDTEGGAELEQRTYTFQPNETDRITVSLVDDETGERVDEWDAMYRTSNHTRWRPVRTDATKPVFYRQLDDEHVEFVFNDPTGEVRFTANPTTLDEVGSSWESWWSGVDVLDGRLGELFGD